MTRTHARRPVTGLVLLLALSSLQGRPAAGQSVTTTTYTYNADGALTRVVEQVDGGAPTTTYLTWDNFVPDAADPTTGAVLPGNGNLVAVGPVPGAPAATRSFTFDAQNRLSSYADAGGSVSYRFHPTWLMAASTLNTGDTRRFYYDNAAARMTNIEDGDSGLMCSEMGPLRSLSNGGLQVLLSPRKDVAGVYDPAQGGFSPYHYDPFGDDGGTAPTAGYDLNSNPHRYAGEYKDPTWGGYYLRARWYDPALQTFISRDPTATLNRYGYTDGNPVSRVDPDGHSSRHWENKPYRWTAAAKWVDRQSGSGHAADRIFLAPVLGPLGLVAEPGAFFHQQKHSAGAFKAWVTVGAVAVGVLMDFAPEWGYANMFALRTLTDVIVGGGVSAANSVSHGGSRFSWRSFGQGMEYTAGGVLYARVLSGRGFRPFNLSVNDILAANPDENEYMVYRVKRPVSLLDASTSGSSRSVLFGAGPGFRTAGAIGDFYNVSLQHEFLIAVTKDGSSLVSEVLTTGFASVELEPEATEEFLGRYAGRAKVRYLGRMTVDDAFEGLRTNPLDLHLMSPGEVARTYPWNTFEHENGEDVRLQAENEGDRGISSSQFYYDPVYRNCMRHVSWTIAQLRFIN